MLTGNRRREARVDRETGRTEPSVPDRQLHPSREQQPGGSARGDAPHAVRGPRSPSAVLALQRGAGNRAVTIALTAQHQSAAAEVRPAASIPTAAPGTPVPAAADGTASITAEPVMEDGQDADVPGGALLTPGRVGDPALRPLPTTGTPAVQRIGEGLLGGLRGRVSVLTGGLRAGWESVRGRAAGALAQVRTAAGAAAGRVRTLGTGLAGRLQQASTAAREVVSGATGRFQMMVGGAVSALSDPVGALRRAVTALDIGALTGVVGRLMSVVDGLSGGVAAAGRALKETVAAAGTRLSGLASAAGATLSTLAGSAVAGVRSLTGSLATGLGAAWTGLSERAGGIDGLASGVTGVAAGMVERLLGGPRALWTGAQNGWSVLSTRLTPAADTATAQVTGAGTASTADLTGVTAQAQTGHEQAAQQATVSVDHVTDGVAGLVRRIRSIPWAAALQRAGEAVPVLRQVEAVVRDPEAAVAPYARGVAEKVHSELPGESRKVLTDHMKQQGVGATASAGPVVQRQTGEDRSVDLGSIGGGLWHVLGQKLSGLSVGFLFQAAMQLVVDLFWPIPAVWAEITGLGSDLVAFAGQFHLPRNPLTDPLGSLHDIWSNMMTVLDLPIVVVRRLSTMGLALMGWVTIILTFAGGVLGTGAGTLVGGVASALASFGLATPAGAVGGGVGGGAAGAGAGFGTAVALGEAVLVAFAAAHLADLVKSLADLVSVRQTAAEKEDDYNQAADSGIALALLIVLLLAGWVGARYAARLVPKLARVVPPRLAAAADEFARGASRRRGPPVSDEHDTGPVRDTEDAPRRDESPAPTEDVAVLTGWRLKLQLLQTRAAALRQRYAASGAADAALDAEITGLENRVGALSDRLGTAGRAEDLPGFGRELRAGESTAYDLEQRVARLVPGPAASPVQQQLSQRLGMDPLTVAGYLDDVQCQRILDLITARGIGRDRLAGLRNFVQEYAARGRTPDKLMELLDTDWPVLRQMLDDRAHVRWDPNWRGRPHIEDGNAVEGWRHIDERHVTGNAPGGHGDLFAPGTTRAQIQAAAEEVVANGTRTSPGGARMQIFQQRMTVNGQSDNILVQVDASDGRVITIFPVRGG